MKRTTKESTPLNNQLGTTIPPLGDILNQLTALFTDYAVLPTPHTAPTLALWVAHTHTSTAFYTTPRLILSSPVPGSGKTRVLELLELVAARATNTNSISPAGMYRLVNKSVEEGHLPPTFLYDEIDAVFNGKPTSGTDDIRSLLNTGYKRGAKTIRCVGDSNDVKSFETFAPVALAGLGGNMPETITTRAITIDMKKRKSDEKVKPYRSRKMREQVAPLVEHLNQWAQQATSHLEYAEPTLPPGVEDRPAEVWEPLLAIAEMAGDEWAAKARAACVSFVFKEKITVPTLGEELLRDIREVMGHGNNPSYVQLDRIRSPELIEALKSIEEGAWKELDGRGLTPRRLSQLLSRYDIAPTVMKVNGKTYKGYMVAGNAKQSGLGDAWSRYLPPVDPMIQRWDSPAPLGSEKPIKELGNIPVTPIEDETPAVSESNLEDKLLTALEGGPLNLGRLMNLGKNSFNAAGTEVIEVADRLVSQGKLAREGINYTLAHAS